MEPKFKKNDFVFCGGGKDFKSCFAEITEVAKIVGAETYVYEIQEGRNRERIHWAKQYRLTLICLAENREGGKEQR